jgi:hypothetical protein
VGDDRKIIGGPLFAVEDIRIALGNGQIRAITPKCRNNLQDLGLDMEDLKELVNDALDIGRYKDSEWAIVNSERGVWIACDAYVLRKEERIKNAIENRVVEYYLKFSLSDTGEMILTVSCHL